MSIEIALFPQNAKQTKTRRRVFRFGKNYAIINDRFEIASNCGLWGKLETRVPEISTRETATFQRAELPINLLCEAGHANQIHSGVNRVLKNYFMVEKSALPDFFLKVVETRRLLETGMCRQVSDAVRRTGISRSTYYKYKDKVLEMSESVSGRKAVLTLTLNHEAGVLSKVLNLLSEHNANILTITQSLPIRNQASVTISLDASGLTGTLDDALAALGNTPGVENAKLIAVE